MKRTPGILALIPVLLNGLLSGGAFAHAHLKSALPTPDSIVATPPQEIRIEFSEKIEPGMSAIEIVGSGGAAVPASGKAFSDPAAPATLVVKLAQPLAAGAYEARWRAVGSDSHMMRGSFHFEVRP